MPGSMPPRGSLAQPLRIPLFRRIWLASLLSNFGSLIQGVGAAWAMMQLTGNAGQVALVQTATALPIMLLAIPAGAVADMFDRRKVTIAAIALSLVSASALAILGELALLTPSILLALCFTVGLGMALFSPAWASSVSEQVPEDDIAQAVALNSISYNIARSFGPAIGGILVAAAGVGAAFASNALSYVPLLLVLAFWKRRQEPPRLPPERIGRAVTSGLRYVANSPPIRSVLVRTLIAGFASAAISALMPIVARDLLGGAATTYGLLLGAFGIGAVSGAFFVPLVRARLSSNHAAAIAALTLAACIAIEAMSSSLILTLCVVGLAGVMWLLTTTLFNITVQLTSPRWVSARALAAFQAALCGGIAVGSWVWGHIAQDYGVATALLAGAATMGGTALLAIWMPLPRETEIDRNSVEVADLEIALALTPRSGPIIIETEYIVRPEQAREFYGVMQMLQPIRHRTGAYGWSISRNIQDPRIWVERFHCPTWLDYLRHRTRQTKAEFDLHRRARAFHCGSEPIRVQRMLERPFGSVRWREDAPDRGIDDLTPIAIG